MKRGLNVFGMFALILFLCIAFVSAAVNDSNLTKLVENSSVIETATNVVGQIIELFISPSKAYLGDLIGISARLAYENDTPVANESLSFYLNDDLIEENYTGKDGLSSIVVRGGVLLGKLKTGAFLKILILTSRS